MLRVPDLAKWQGRQWALFLSILLLVTLTPLGWIQWMQYKTLDDLSVNQVDSFMWQAYQLERETSRLKQVLLDAGDDTKSVTIDELDLRYEVFLSRIDLITNFPRRDLLASTKEYTESVILMTAFAEWSDPIFEDPQRVLRDDATRKEILQQLTGLGAPLAKLTREANRAAARFVDQRNRQLRQQGILISSLAAAQIVVLLLFVWLLVRNLRRQQKQLASLQRLSQEVEVARDQAEAANQGKSTFLANMSHEIRTPFQGLLGMLNMLDDASLNNLQRDYLRTARDSALHLLGVLNDILDVSTMESGTLTLSGAPVHLPTVAREVDGLMQVAARDKGLELHLRVAPDLPVWVVADATRLRQIMFNLINNAIKFTPKGRIQSELKPDPSEAGGILFTVQDTGVGMDQDTMKRLFTRFYQSDNSLRRRVAGTGLGLEISRNLARLMDGDITVQSALGEGSTFTVRLKLPPSNPPAAEAKVGTYLPKSKALRILVAEDHPINLKYMGLLLDKMGHLATYCENGQEALNLLEKNTYDVVLLDYHMPVLDGLATTEIIRSLKGPKAKTKIVLVTADVVNDTRIRAQEAGVDEFISKPLQHDTLQRALANCGPLEGASPTKATNKTSSDLDLDLDSLLDSPLDPSPGTSGTSTRPVGGFPYSSYDLPLRNPEDGLPINELIDTESFTELLDMMPPDSLNDLLRTVFDPPDGTAHELAQSIATGDRIAVGYNAHKLKGIAMLLGFRALVSTSTQIEYLANQTNDPIGNEIGEQVLRDAILTREAIEHFKIT